MGLYFPTAEGTVIGSEHGFETSYNELKELEVDMRQNGQKQPFKSKVAAKRYFKSRGVKLVKGDSVRYYCRGELRTTW